MKQIQRSFPPFLRLKKGSCQSLAKECAPSTGNLPRRFVGNSVDRLTDRARNYFKKCQSAVKHQLNINNNKDIKKVRNMVISMIVRVRVHIVKD